jgi:hypothetical protein
MVILRLFCRLTEYQESGLRNPGISLSKSHKGFLDCDQNRNCDYHQHNLFRDALRCLLKPNRSLMVIAVQEHELAHYRNKNNVTSL